MESWMERGNRVEVEWDREGEQGAVEVEWRGIKMGSCVQVEWDGEGDQDVSVVG